MSFKDIKYFRDYVESRIIQYRSNPKNFTEADIRSIFSRAYYTILLHCRDVLNLTNIVDESIHWHVRNSINNQHIKKDVQSYCSIRNKMDYNNVSLDLKNTGKILADLNSIKRDMNYILSLNKDELNN